MLKYIGWQRDQQMPLIYPYINLIKFLKDCEKYLIEYNHVWASQVSQW